MKKSNGFKSFMRKLDGLPEVDYYDKKFFYSLEILYKDYKLSACKDFLSGNYRCIIDCFSWGDTPFCEDWVRIYHRRIEPTEEHFAYVRWFIKQMELNR